MRIPQKPRWTMWDHNAHYHGTLLELVPTGCRRALDVGCGAGQFASLVAERSEEVVGIDRDRDILDAARDHSAHPRLTFLEGDFLTADLGPGGFDFISCIVGIHHMNFAAALVRFRSLLAPGGVVAVLGLYRHATMIDFAHYVAVTPVDLAVGVIRSRRKNALPAAPVAEWTMTLHDIRSEADRALPGATVRRRMYYRHTLEYRSPADGALA